MADSIPLQQIGQPHIIHQVPPTTYKDTLFSFTWYSVEFITYICIIAYVFYTFKIIGPWKMKQNVSETGIDTWSQTSTLLSSAADIAQKFNKAFDKKSEGEEVKKEK